MLTLNLADRINVTLISCCLYLVFCLLCMGEYVPKSMVFGSFYPEFSCFLPISLSLLSVSLIISSFSASLLIFIQGAPKNLWENGIT